MRVAMATITKLNHLSGQVISAKKKQQKKCIFPLDAF